MNAITLKRIVKSYLLIFLFLISISCHQNESQFKEQLSLENVDLRNDYDGVDDKTTDTDKKNDYKTQTRGLTPQTKSEERTSNIPKDLKIIKTASTKYKVINIEKALADIKDEMYINGGYISELRYDKNYHTKQNRFTIKIPKDKFNTMLEGIKKFAEETDYVNISTTDVTEKYMDIQIRLQTKLEVKKRLEAVLRRNAKTVKDILATENQLRIIQEEIEVAQGKIKYMSNRVAYSTIQVEIYETITYKEEPVAYKKGFLAKAKEGLSEGWNFIQILVIALFHIWPIILLSAIGIFFYKRWKKAKK
ncbi:DUF4349 domain-containing protein [uncultured Kordia sp.]|uniref:DUF4349 domain-containing protein n=1 Tax=uncultured Kordia sp. TaxID=507699 RepID=UPI00263665A5|nr:DUF4349 domain-containing protein [uncultured Kordia sp.]